MQDMARMHRRQFIQATAGALLLPPMMASARQDEATPAPIPPHHGRTRPIVLGDGIELIDYRIYPSEDVPRIIGEISSTRDEMVDSPVVSVTFPELGKDGLAWAPPVLPVMRPGESNMIFGVLPREIDSEEKLEAAKFGLCAPVVAGRHTRMNVGRQWSITNYEDDKRAGSQNLRGNLVNEGVGIAFTPVLQGLIRDANGRVVGTTLKADYPNMAPGASYPFSVWAGGNGFNRANPFLLLGDSVDYMTTLIPCSGGLRVSPGCSSLL